MYTPVDIYSYTHMYIYVYIYIHKNIHIYIHKRAPCTFGQICRGFLLCDY